VKSGWYLRELLVLIFGMDTGFGGITLMSLTFFAVALGKPLAFGDLTGGFIIG
jgi:hypothetical protein